MVTRRTILAFRYILQPVFIAKRPHRTLDALIRSFGTIISRQTLVSRRAVRRARAIGRRHAHVSRIAQIRVFSQTHAVTVGATGTRLTLGFILQSCLVAIVTLGAQILTGALGALGTEGSRGTFRGDDYAVTGYIVEIGCFGSVTVAGKKITATAEHMVTNFGLT